MVFLPSERLLSLYLGGTEMKSSVHWSDSCKQKCSLWSSRPPSELKPASLRCEWLPLSGFCYCSLPFPACFPLYKRGFSPRDELWLVLNVLGVKHPVFLWVIWPCQRPTAFPNDIMGFSWGLLEKSAYGSQGTSACPSTFQGGFLRCWERSLRMCAIFVQKQGLANSGLTTQPCNSGSGCFCKEHLLGTHLSWCASVLAMVIFTPPVRGIELICQSLYGPQSSKSFP